MGLFSRKSDRDKRKEIGREVGSGIKKKGRGRPAGSYDQRYRAYGGVYGYRKILTAQLRQQRLQSLRDAAVTPQQQNILAQIEARQRAQQTSPENQLIPDTRGQVPMKSIHQEADEYANIFP